MRRLRLDLRVLFCLALLTACAPATSSPTETGMEAPTQAIETSPTETQTPPPATTFIPETVTDLPPATSITLTTAGDTLYVIVGREESLYVMRSTDGGQTFSESVSATGVQPAHVLRVERPAIAANEQGQVSVAWLEIDMGGGENKVWYASSSDGSETFGPAQLVGTEPPGEVTMVEIVLDGAGNPLLSWLNGNDLRFSRSADGGQTFSSAQTIGDGACECCQPDMLMNGDELLIGYRGVGEAEHGQFRDAALIRSLDGGTSFEPVTLATDSHWYINACPISGPSIGMADGEIYITWMDGRDIAPDNLQSSDVWFARSTDGGQTFSSNVKLSSGLSTHNFLPVMAVGPSGRIHVAWQAITADAIYYATSDDGGQSFSAPQIIADDNDPERGRPISPTIAMDGQGQVYLAWLDDVGVRVAVWEDAE